MIIAIMEDEHELVCNIYRMVSFSMTMSEYFGWLLRLNIQPLPRFRILLFSQHNVSKHTNNRHKP